MIEDEVLNATNQFNKIRLDIEKLIFSLENNDFLAIDKKLSLYCIPITV